MKDRNRHNIMRLFRSLLFFGIAAMAAPSAYAQCSSPAGVAGQQIYSANHNIMQFCNGADWINMGVAPSGGTTALSGLTDVDVAGAANGNCLVYNNGTSKWEDGACGAGGDNLGNHTATQALDMGGFNITNAGTITGNGSPLTNLNASNLATGTVGTARLGSGTADGTTFLRGDGTWQAPPSGADDLGDHTASQNLDMATFKVIGLGAPAAGTDAATKAYVDGLTGPNETDPQVGVTTNGNWCVGTGTQVTCTQAAPLTAESDPQVATLTGSKWCAANAGGTAIDCTQDAPSGGGDNLGNHTATTDLNLAGNDLTGAADIFFTGVFADVSDIRLKDDVAPLGGALRDIAALQGLSYRMKGDWARRTEYGFSAQEVRKVYPDLVLDNPGAPGTLAVNYIGLIAPMVEAIKELKAENDALRARLEALERKTFEK